MACHTVAYCTETAGAAAADHNQLERQRADMAENCHSDAEHGHRNHGRSFVEGLLIGNKALDARNLDPDAVRNCNLIGNAVGPLKSGEEDRKHVEEQNAGQIPGNDLFVLRSNHNRHHVGASLACLEVVFAPNLSDPLVDDSLHMLTNIVDCGMNMVLAADNHTRSGEPYDDLEDPIGVVQGVRGADSLAG